MSRTPHTELRRLGTGALVYLVAFALSVGLHLGAAAPYVAWGWVTQVLDTPGEGGVEDGPTGNGGVEYTELVEPAMPVQVSVYTPAPKASTRPAAPAATESVDSAVAADSLPDPSTRPGAAGKIPHRRSSDHVKATPKEGMAGKPPRGKKKPCEPIEEVVKLGDSRWRVERDLLDWYATHLRQLEKQAGVATHRDSDGNRDGARLYLPRCSVLKQGGFKNGDIIRSVEGRKVYTIPQAVATYLSVRKNKTVTIELTRKTGEKRTHKYKLK